MTQFLRHPAHPPPIRRSNQPIILLVTLCARRGGVELANPVAQAAMVRAWQEATHWRAGEYVIMPDHVHLFCAPGAHEYPPIRRWAGYWKRLAGQYEPQLKSAFQEDCWDTQMRDGAHFDEKLSYVRRNPERKGLVTTWKDWRFCGSVFAVHWL